jgi:hypothetical protein
MNNELKEKNSRQYTKSSVNSKFQYLEIQANTLYLCIGFVVKPVNFPNNLIL